MTDYIATIVKQAQRFRVAITPVSKAGASPIVATSWAEQDGRIFETDSHAAAEAFIGQMSDKFWTATDRMTALMAATSITVRGDFPGDAVEPGRVSIVSATPTHDLRAVKGRKR